MHTQYGCAVLLALVATAAVAEEEKILPTITVNSKSTSSPMVVPGQRITAMPVRATGITHEEIRVTNVGREISDLLRRVPGVIAHTVGQGDLGQSVKMRGFMTQSHGADVAVYIDGIPQNIPSSAINHGMNDMSWLTPEMIEQIDVIKGPFSAWYGDQNRAGAVDIRTRIVSRNSIGIRAGTHGSRGINTVLSGRHGHMMGLLVADWYRTDGYRDNNDGQRRNVFAKASVEHEGALWGLRGFHQKADWQSPGFLSVSDLMAGKVQAQQRDTSTLPLAGDGKRTGIAVSREPVHSEEGHRYVLYAEDYQRTRGVGGGKTGVNMLADDRRIVGMRAAYDAQAGERSWLGIGAELRYDNGSAISRRWDNGVPTQQYNFYQDLDLLTYGVFAQGQYRMSDTFKLVGGIRADGFDYTIENRKLMNASMTYRKYVVTPRLGVVWAMTPFLDLFANRGTGYRSPQFAELSTSGALGPLGQAGGKSYPDLAPPTATSHDIGVALHVNTRLSGGIAAYDTINDNEIVQTDPGVYAAVGETARRGWEADIRYALTEQLALYASYGRILKARIENAQPGTASALSVPRHTYKAGMTYWREMAGGRVHINADMMWLAKVPYYNGAAPAVREYAHPYARYDLRVGYERSRTEWTLATTVQPHRYGSEVVLSNGRIDPQPKWHTNLSVRYYFD